MHRSPTSASDASTNPSRSDQANMVPEGASDALMASAVIPPSPAQAGWKVDLSAQPGPTVVSARNLTIGGGHFGIIAGPCSVENREQIGQCARQLSQQGIPGLRGGAFKPRTSPYSFQGLKEEGLQLLAEVRQQSDLAIVTEVMTPSAVDSVAQVADLLQIGARNMQNFDLLREVGQQPKPVLLKRGPSATLTEFLLAAEYILDQGNGQVVLCERGIRTFEDHVRFTLPLATIPALKERTHLPVIVDPSHGTGKRSYVPAMAYAAVAAGADGLLVEMHPDPDQAVSDGDQSLTFELFHQMVDGLPAFLNVVGKTLSLTKKLDDT